MTNHTVKAFDEELGVLSRKINEMGGIAEAMLVEAIDALVKGDKTRAEAVVQRDKALDALQQEIEDLAVVFIAKRQPMANDLRAVMGTVRIAGDIERIGDLFKNIGKRVRAMDSTMIGTRTLSGIQNMARMVQEQLKLVLDSYSQNRPDLAREVWLRDEGRCTFVGSHGRCRERGMLEYHHREPFAAGGEATVSNVALLCRAHNGLEAERLFGPFVAAMAVIRFSGRVA